MANKQTPSEALVKVIKLFTQMQTISSKGLSDGKIDTDAFNACAAQVETELTLCGECFGEQEATIKEVTGSIEALKTNVDKALEAIDEGKKANLQLRNGRFEDQDPEQIRRIRKARLVFQSGEKAALFGAWGLKKLLGEKFAGAHPTIKTMAEAALKDFDPGVAGDGGALIPDLFVGELIRNLESAGTLYTQMRRVPLGTTGVTTWPKRTSGMTAYPLTASAEFIESSIGFSEITLTPVKWGVLGSLPNEFLRNPNLLANIGQLIADESVRGMALGWDDAVINGDGGANYGNILGIFNDPAIAEVAAAATHTTLATVDGVDITNVIAAITADYVQNPNWSLHMAIQQKLRNVRDSDGRRLWGDNAAPGLANIDGYPFSLCSSMPPTAGSAGSKYAIFGELMESHYFGMLGNLELAISDQVKFTSDQTVYRTLAHVDVATVDANAVVVAKTAAA